MPKYTPPPDSLDDLNPIQRYMQKGSLEKRDYVWLAALVLAYFTARPYIQRFFKYFMGGDDLIEGEQAQKDYLKSKAKVAPNQIRTSKGQKEDSIPEISGTVKTSGSKIDEYGSVKNRRHQDQTALNKSEQDALLDWDDEPAREAVPGDKSDIVAWLDKWDK